MFFCGCCFVGAGRGQLWHHFLTLGCATAAETTGLCCAQGPTAGLTNDYDYTNASQCTHDHGVANNATGSK